jgi:GDPmannose 4,6-dehydratase
MKNIFISGVTGQDGAYLAKYHLDKGNNVIGGARRSSERTFWRLEKLGIKDKVKIVDFDLLDYHNMVNIIKETDIDEFYNLAAQSFVGTSFRQPFYSLKCNGLAVCELVEILLEYRPDTKFYQASTSEMFGEIREPKQNELTPFNPSSPYGIAKLMAHNFVEVYRKSYGFLGYCGILFNHESALRGDEFVTKKISNWVRNYYKGKLEVIKPLQLGNIYSERDWGHSRDYVEAMAMMLEGKPDTYVIATGKKYSVKDFVNMCFDEIGVELKWEGVGVEEKAININTGEVVVEINEKFYRPNDVEVLLGDNTKAKESFDWQPKSSIEDLVSDMVWDKV